MLYSNPPLKVRCHNLADLTQVGKLAKLFYAYGYGIAEYGSEAVKFYSTRNQREDGGVPVSDWYCVKKQEFSAFVDLLQKLDIKAEDLKKYQRFVERVL